MLDLLVEADIPLTQLLLRAPEARRHAVKIGRELSQLVLAVHPHLTCEVTGGHLADCIGHLSYRA